jgi:hypothetical protein
MIRRPAVWAGVILAIGVTLPAGATYAQGDGREPGSGLLGADTVVLEESFDTEAPWMGIGSDESGENDLRKGALSVSYLHGPGNGWTDLELAAPAAVLRAEVTVDLDGAPGTAAGPACGSSRGLPRWLVAGVNGGDEWWLGRLIDGRLQVVDRGLLMSPITPSQAAVRVAIECAVVPEEGGDRVTMTVDGRPVAVTLPWLEIPVGPYGGAALLLATDDTEAGATFDDLVVSTGSSYAPAPVDRVPDQPSE